ncbi:NB-ARC domain-containing protein [Streptomyces sp. IBSBF 2806]|uniref:NB-ARC domain-containing protein n=1 Tax=Streptomyces sp. IBSBF 2806 TaxID=2903529 RepID=UPI002FDBFDE1
MTAPRSVVPREPAAWPHQVGVIPSRAHFFQRRVEGEGLDTAQWSSGTSVIDRTPYDGVADWIITGMGGVGKTQLAAEHARTAWLDGGLDLLVWISAGDRAAVVTGYAQAGVELCRADPNDSEQAANAFLAWLTPKAGAQPCRWLVVLDDVADPDDLRNLWPPAGPYGRTLVTTRRRDAALVGNRRLIEVGPFTGSDAVDYLRRSLGRRFADVPGPLLGDLARDLGHLPLALSQASAFIRDSGDGVDAYRTLLADRSVTLGEAAPDRLPDGQTDTLAAAWSLSLDRAEDSGAGPVVRPLLHLVSMLDPNGIPAAVLCGSPVLAHLGRTAAGDRSTSPAETTAVTALDVTRGLRALHRLSLVDHTPGTPMHAVRVHQLVQRAVRESLDDATRTVVEEVAADALVEQWPAVEKQGPLVQSLRANSVALLGHCAGALVRDQEAHPLTRMLGQSLGTGGQFLAAHRHFRGVAEVLHRRLGPHHRTTHLARHEAALWRAETGDRAPAIAELKQVLADQERHRGSGRLDRIATRRTLLHLIGLEGNAAGAAAAAKALLADVRRAVGPEHPETLAVQFQAALWRGESGDASGAVRACEELEAVQRRVLGATHPETFATRCSLARWRGESGDAQGCLRAFEQVLAEQRSVLGFDDVRTFTTRYELAFACGVFGDPRRSVSILDPLIRDQERVLGPDSLGTLFSRHARGLWLSECGEHSRALHEFDQLIEAHVRAFGEGGVHLLIARFGRARVQGDAGDPLRALASLEGLLACMTEVFGEDGRRTLDVRFSMARCRALSGDVPQALTEMDSLHRDQVRVLGRGSPDARKTDRERSAWRRMTSPVVMARETRSSE